MMGIIDYIYFRFVALRKLAKAFNTEDIMLSIKPEFQVGRAKNEKRWVFSDRYKMRIVIGVKDYKVAGDSMKAILAELIEISKDA